MKHAMLSVLFSLACALPAHARVFEGGITHDELKKLMVEAGFSAVTVEDKDAEPGAVPDLVVMGGPARWYVHLAACEGGRCDDLHLDAGFNLDTPVAPSLVAEINAVMLGHLGGNVYIDDDGDPILQSDVNTDGVSANNIRFQMRAFETMARCLAVRIDFDDTAGACDRLPERLDELARQGVAAEDVSEVVVAVGLDELERILRDSGYEPRRNAPDSGLVSLTVIHEGIRWTAAVHESRMDQINGSIFLVFRCAACSADGARRANAYNSGRRWLTALVQDGQVAATMTVPLSGGVTEVSIGLMIRSFHLWAKNFESDFPK